MSSTITRDFTTNSNYTKSDDTKIQADGTNGTSVDFADLNPELIE